MSLFAHLKHRSNQYISNQTSTDIVIMLDGDELEFLLVDLRKCELYIARYSKYKKMSI